MSNDTQNSNWPNINFADLFGSASDSASDAFNYSAQNKPDWLNFKNIFGVLAGVMVLSWLPKTLLGAFTGKDETGNKNPLGFIGKIVSTALAGGAGVAGVNALTSAVEGAKSPSKPNTSLSSNFSQAALNTASQQSGLDQNTVSSLAAQFKQFATEHNGAPTDAHKSEFAKEFADKHNGASSAPIQEQQVLTAINTLQVAAP